MATRCFKNIGFNVFHFINESLNAVFYCIVLVGSLKSVDGISEENSYLCMNLVLISWGLNIGLSILRSLYRIILKIKDCIRKKRADVLATRTTPENFDGIIVAQKTRAENVVVEEGGFDFFNEDKKNEENINDDSGLN